MSNCGNTGLTIPECSCPACIERQLLEFAPTAVVSPIRQAGDDTGVRGDAGEGRQIAA